MQGHLLRATREDLLERGKCSTSSISQAESCDLRPDSTHSIQLHDRISEVGSLGTDCEMEISFSRGDGGALSLTGLEGKQQPWSE